MRAIRSRSVRSIRDLLAFCVLASAPVWPQDNAAALNRVLTAMDTAAKSFRTTEASVGEVIEPKSIRELPLNGRMLIDLVLTVPGAHVGFGAQTGSTNPLYWRPGQRSAVVIGGSRPNANFFLLD